MSDCPPESVYYNEYDYSPAPSNFVFTVNGTDQTGNLAISGPTDEQCTPQGNYGGYDCARTYTAAGTVALAAGAANTLNAALGPSYPWSHQSAVVTAGAPTSSGGPEVTLVSPALSRDPARCALDCGELVEAYTTPAYLSRDVARGLSLVYRSDRAHPLPVVEVDVTSISAGAARLGLKLLDAAGAAVALTHGATEVVRQYAPGAPNRLAAQFDASGLPTGAPTYTAVVTAYDAGGAPLGQTSLPVRVLVDALNGPASPYGAGWGIAGLKQARWNNGDPRDGEVIVDGDGTMAFYPFASQSGNVYTYSSPPGDFSTVTWDAGTGVLTQRYPDGTVVQIDGANGSQSSVTDRLGNVMRFAYAYGDNRLTGITDPAGHTVSLDYWGPNPWGWREGALAITLDNLGRNVSFGVDAANDLRVVNEPQGADNAARAETHRYAYNAHRLAQAQDARGGTWDYLYDGFGTVSRATGPAAVGPGGTGRPSTDFLSWARAVLVGSGAGTQSSPAPALDPQAARAAAYDNGTGLQTAYRVDRWGAPDRVEAPGGVVTTATRDGYGHVTRIVDAQGQAVDYVWNQARPWLLDSTYDAAAKVGTAFAYDAATDYALREVRVGGQEQQRITYSGGRVATVRVGGSSQKASVYDYTGRLASDPRPAAVADPRGHVTHYAYEPAGLQNASGVTTQAGTSSVLRDAYGRDSVTTDPLGRRTVATYDVLNRPLTLTDPAGKTTTTAYDALFPRTVTDAIGQVYRDSTNALGLPVASYDPAGSPVTTAYDAAGRVSDVINRRGQSYTFRYDPQLGHVTDLWTPGGADNVAYGTDALGRVRWARNAEGADSVFADSLGRDTLAVRYIAQVGNARYLVRSTYDALGRRSAVTVAREGPFEPGNTSIGAGTTRYWYGAAGQLDSLSAHGGTTRAWYNDDLAPDSVRLENGAVVRNRFTPAHGLAERHYLPAALDALFGRVYARDSLGRVTKRFNANQSAFRAFEYDRVGRLGTIQDGTVTGGSCGPADPGSTQVVLDDGTTNWQCTSATVAYGAMRAASYDAVGNSASIGAVIDPGNVQRRSAFDTYTHDADGNLTGRYPDARNGLASQRLSWNALGQLTGVWNDPDPAAQTGRTDSVTFGYDGWGRRVRTTNVTTGATRFYVWDGDDLIAEVNASGRIGARYAYYPGGPDRPHSVEVARAGGVPPVVYYYVTETPGHVVGLLDANRAAVARYAYDVFGTADTVQENLGGWSNRLRFGAREYDRETGLYYQRARYYDPDAGQFVSRDPVGLAGGINWYTYAGNDPVNNIDPTGMETCTYEWVPDGYATAGGVTTVTRGYFLKKCGGGSGGSTSGVTSTPAGTGANPGQRGGTSGGGRGARPASPKSAPPNQCAMIGGTLGDNIRAAQALRVTFEADLRAFAYVDGGFQAAVTGHFMQFSNRVQGGGPWDVKTQGQTPWFGNWHYGVVGAAAGFPLNVLQRGAGLNQQFGSSQKGEYNPQWGHAWDTGPSFYGDTPIAQQNMRDGYNWYQRGCR